jgi:arginine decarboxylase
MPKNVQEAYHDAQQGKEEAESLFKLGYLSLRELAQAQRLFWACCEKIAATAARLKRVPEEIGDLHDQMAAIYYGNFSIFQSVPDSWAIDQLFPIMPIHRLTEEPTVRCVIADLTCDSDGKIDRFIDVEDPKPVLEVHTVRPDEPYVMAIFLNGAYQEILGDLHNLFGDTNAVHVRLSDDGDEYEVSHVVKGDSIHEVLDYVEYEPSVMIERMRLQAERAKREGRITVDQVKLLLRHYEESLGSYTYLTDD